MSSPLEMKIEPIDGFDEYVYELVTRVDGVIIKRVRIWRGIVGPVALGQAQVDSLNKALAESFVDWERRPGHGRVTSLPRDHSYVGDMVVAGTAALLAAVTLAKDPPALLTAVVAVYLLAVLCYVGRHIYQGLR